jgi:uncharacterized membrane protein YfcA
MQDAAILAISGFAAGSMNALAGGGSFVSLPALMATGMSSVIANATSSVALWPGGLASAIVYRERPPVAGMRFPLMVMLTLAGGAAGALLLIATPVRLFDGLLPWLLLIATAALAFAPRIASHVQARSPHHRGLLLAVQFLLGIYGGYYGGAVGLTMLAMWSLVDGAGIKALAGTRTAMVTAANAAAIFCFAIAGVVDWRAALILGAGALAGGYAGARIGRRLPAGLVRAGTLTLCTAITIAFFIRAYR